MSKNKHVHAHKCWSRAGIEPTTEPQRLSSVGWSPCAGQPARARRRRGRRRRRGAALASAPRAAAAAAACRGRTPPAACPAAPTARWRWRTGPGSRVFLHYREHAPLTNIKTEYCTDILRILCQGTVGQ